MTDAKLVKLPEARLRKLPLKDLRRAYETVTDAFVLGLDVSAEDARRVTDVWNARQAERRPRPEKKSKEYRTDGLVEFKF